MRSLCLEERANKQTYTHSEQIYSAAHTLRQQTGRECNDAVSKRQLQTVPNCRLLFQHSETKLRQETAGPEVDKRKVAHIQVGSEFGTCGFGVESYNIMWQSSPAQTFQNDTS